MSAVSNILQAAKMFTKNSALLRGEVGYNSTNGRNVKDIDEFLQGADEYISELECDKVGEDDLLRVAYLKEELEVFLNAIVRQIKRRSGPYLNYKAKRGATESYDDSVEGLFVGQRKKKVEEILKCIEDLETKAAAAAAPSPPPNAYSAAGGGRRNRRNTRRNRRGTRRGTRRNKRV